MKNKYLLFLFFMALLLRLVYVIFYPQLPLVNDAESYDLIAQNIVEKGLFSLDSNNITTDRAPGYPFFLAVIYYFFGKSIFAVRIVQAFLSAIMVVFVYSIANRYFNSKIAFFSGLFVGIYPPFIFYSGLLLTEIIYSFFLVVVFYLLLMYKLNYFLSAILGLFFGVIVLVKPEAVFIPFFLFALFYVSSVFGKMKFDGNLMNHLVIVIFFMFVVIFLWTMITYPVYNRFFFIHTRSALDLWISTRPDYDFQNTGFPKHIMLKTTNMTEIEAYDFLKNEAKKNLINHPVTYLKISVQRIFRFWIASHTEVLSGFTESFASASNNKHFFIFSIKLLLLLFNSFFVLLGFLGLFWLFYDKHVDSYVKLLIISPILFKIIIHTIFFMTARYHTHIMPFMLLLASYALVSLNNFLRMTPGKNV